MGVGNDVVRCHGPETMKQSHLGINFVFPRCPFALLLRCVSTGLLAAYPSAELIYTYRWLPDRDRIRCPDPDHYGLRTLTITSSINLSLHIQLILSFPSNSNFPRQSSDHVSHGRMDAIIKQAQDVFEGQIVSQFQGCHAKR